MENQAKLRGKVGAALAYPVLMMIIGSALISVMMVVVVPKVTASSRASIARCPGTREALIVVSHFVASNQMLGFVVSIVTLHVHARRRCRDYKDERAKQAPGLRRRGRSSRACIARDVRLRGRVARRVRHRCRARRRRRPRARVAHGVRRHARRARLARTGSSSRSRSSGRSSACSPSRASRARSRRCCRAACRCSRRWRSSRTSSTTRKLEKVIETAAGIDPRGRVDRRPAQAERRLPADRDPHDRRRREERAARADARERRATRTTRRSRRACRR